MSRTKMTPAEKAGRQIFRAFIELEHISAQDCFEAFRLAAQFLDQLGHTTSTEYADHCVMLANARWLADMTGGNWRNITGTLEDPWYEPKDKIGPKLVQNPAKDS